MRLTLIEVFGLYGIFKHRIPMDNPQPVTLLHGPNGFGKTVILKMIAAAFESDSAIFRKTPFSSFKMTFDDGSSWEIQRSSPVDESGKTSEPKLQAVTRSSAGNISIVEVGVAGEVSAAILDEIDTEIPPPFSRWGRGWRRDDEGDFYSLQDILKIFPDAISDLPKEIQDKIYSKSWAPTSAEVFVVEADRLRVSGPVEHEPRRPIRNRLEAESRAKLIRVEQYSRDVVKRISSVLASYAKSSQERDRTFPERLVQFFRENRTPMEAKVILERMQDLEKKRQRLISLGFLDSETGLRDLTEDEVRKAPEALTIYVEDVATKLSAFDEMASRVGKLIDIINARFEYKHIDITRESGFRILHDSGFPVLLSDLSSGEQNELVVLYELLFMAPLNGLVLVDEPEISLHVAWQSRFLSDLIEILKISKSYALVATHSPVVIGNQWNLAVELTGPTPKKRAGSL